MQAAVTWAREHGIIVASDECYAEFTWDEPAVPLAGDRARRRADGVLAVHSLSKRSNMAGLRAGFVAGDPRLVSYLGEIRKHAGMMVPAPVQAAAAAALGDDDHVAEQRGALRGAAGPSRSTGSRAARPRHDGGTSTFYLWLRGARATPTAGSRGAASPRPVSSSRRATSTARAGRPTSGSRSPSTDDALEPGPSAGSPAPRPRD